MSDKGNVTLTLHENDVYGIQALTEFKGIEAAQVGTEVTLNIQARNFQNKGEFYTDSNGLQMQKRIIDKRPDWDLKIEGTEHISANYYPINSAITMKCDNFKDWITLLNDRSQGGSVLKDGVIETMIDRRLMKDDNKGLEEALNETDSSGNPLPVTTHHIILLEKNMQNFSSTFNHSRLKVSQNRLASDVQATVIKTPNRIRSSLKRVLIEASDYKTFLQQVYPVSFDEIILRIENAEDWITAPDIEYMKFDIHKIASDIYAQANEGIAPDSISIQEVTLSASETIEERAKHKLVWKTEDDHKTVKIQRKKDEIFRQEMRTYRIKYGSESVSQMQATA